MSQSSAQPIPSHCHPPSCPSSAPPTPNTSPISVRYHESATAHPPPDLLQACSAAEGALQTGSWAVTSNTVSPSNPLELKNIEKLLKTQKQRVAGGIRGRIWAIITCSILSLKKSYNNNFSSFPPKHQICCISVRQMSDLGQGHVLGKLSQEMQWVYCYPNTHPHV